MAPKPVLFISDIKRAILKRAVGLPSALCICLTLSLFMFSQSRGGSFSVAEDRLKIIDFGLARELGLYSDRIPITMCGTLEFMSPEVSQYSRFFFPFTSSFISSEISLLPGLSSLASKKHGISFSQRTLSHVLFILFGINSFFKTKFILL